MPRRNVWVLGVLIVVCLACYGRVHRYGRILSYAMEQIDRRSLEAVDEQKLFEGALEGMMAQLQDPHSGYIRPKALEEVEQSIDQKFVGVGIEVTLDPQTKQLTVATPLFGSPAQEAGIRPGDKILRIDGKSTHGIFPEQATEMIRGREGTPVVLTVQHEDEDKPVDIRIVRAEVRVDTVLGYGRNADGSWSYFLEGHDHVGYVRITTFGKQTDLELKQALRGMLADGMKGLILDLRNDPGGLLESAVAVCDFFVSSGVIVTTRVRDGSIRRSYEAHQEGTLPDFPLAVLVNRYSASAAEIVAACLQDHRRGVVVGERTYGKGTVQEIIDLQADQGALKLTTASYWRPSQKNINRPKDADESAEWGVLPNPGYEVPLDGEKLARLIRWRAEHDAFHAPKVAPGKNGKPAAAEARFQTDVDPQLVKAVQYVEQEITQRTRGLP